MVIHASEITLSPKPIGETLADVAEAAGQHAPYLSRLLSRRGNDLDLSSSASLAAQCESIIAKTHELAAIPQRYEELGQELRRAKQFLHLSLALMDLSCAWTHDKVTDVLSRFADAALEASLAAALAVHDVSSRGFFIVGFGKLGAFELNYSSDIDLAAFFDPELFDAGSRSPQDVAVRVVRDLCKLMEGQTEHGYVFRTDLRLRPDPSATPAAVSTRRAAIYYEEVGQNWERMAWIKARPCAGDMQAAKGFHGALESFVWRRHLDYWTVADVQAIKRMINTRVGDPEIEAVDCDVKLGPGGIREIEFFAQTQQIILGGRDPTLRGRGTLESLAALAQAGTLPRVEAEMLTRAYGGLRAVEHRVQMLNDTQTHSVPADEDRRRSVAALMGMASLSDFDSSLIDTRRLVNASYSALFAEDAGANRPAPSGNLVFTGIEDDPGTVSTLSGMGFDDPSRVIAAFRRWHRGFVAATRSARGQALLTQITPNLLEAMAATGDASSAFANFERFFEGLNAGVQLLSMLSMEDELLDDLVASLAVAPRLARILSQRPSLLESLITANRLAGLPVKPEMPFEDAMDAARRHHRDEVFLIGHALLNGRLKAREAAKAWSQLAGDVVSAMADAASAETERRFGPAPGRWAVMAMGSFGARELTAGSDLDMIILYDIDEDDGANVWFTRFTQRLTTALSAPTAEGVLYEVDMRLRPSGRAGPVAVRLSAFEQYHAKDAWTWERMALTRMAFATGDRRLAQQALDIAVTSINDHRSDSALWSDIDDMRTRLKTEKPASGLLDIKAMPGGLVDIEFKTQRHLLSRGGSASIIPNTFDALTHLGQTGDLEVSVVKTLQSAWVFQSALRQILNLSLDQIGDPDALSKGLKERLCRAVGHETFDSVEQTLEAHYAAVLAVL